MRSFSKKATLPFLFFLFNLLLINTKSHAQNYIFGTVRDADGPLIGAAVNIKSTNQFAIVDTAGQFSLQYDKLPIF